MAVSCKRNLDWLGFDALLRKPFISSSILFRATLTARGFLEQQQVVAQQLAVRSRVRRQQWPQRPLHLPASRDRDVQQTINAAHYCT